MNFYWANVDGKLSIDHGGHTATLTRLADKQWRAHVVIRKQRSGGGSYKTLREHSNGFNTRREAAYWAAVNIGLELHFDLMTFAMLPASVPTPTPTAPTRRLRSGQPKAPA